MKRRTKIVATLGPVSRDETTITRLIREGMNVARLNFSHGTHKEFARMIRLIRKTAHRLGQPVCILQDLQGPKLRITEIAQGEVELHPGQPFTLTTESVPGDDKLVGVDFKELPHAVSAGGRILIDDGQVELQVTRIDGEQVETEVVIGGKLTSHKGINLPDSQLDIPNFTEKDESDLAFGLEHESTRWTPWQFPSSEPRRM
jgi:pyruvate kinase